MKKLKNKILKKLIFVVMLTMVLINCYFILGGNIILAADPSSTSALSKAMEEDNSAWGLIGGMLNGLVAVLFFVPRIIILALGFLIKMLLSAIASISFSDGTWVTIEHVLFAGYKGDHFQGIDFLDVNFFQMGAGVNDNIDAFRVAVAKWYYIIRLIAAAILLVILIYVGIRMALSTIASDQAKYKKMLTDWVVSLALLFLLHYIIIFIIEVNSALVSAMGGMINTVPVEDKSWIMSAVKTVRDVGDDWEPTVGEYLNAQIVTDIWSEGITGFLAACIYLFMQTMALAFMLFYLKRMITVGFLIIIAPLITITYSLDKMGDNKAQALNAWLKELAYNILIQPFHCIIYLAFFGAMSTILANATWGSVGVYILVFAIFKFMKQAEDILRKIFHFEANSMPSISQPGKDFMAATGKMAGVGMGLARGGRYFKQAGGFKALTKGRKSLEDKIIDHKANAALKESTGKKGKAFREYKKTDEYKRDFQSQRKQTMKEYKDDEIRRKAKRARKKDKNYDRKLEDAIRTEYDRRCGEGEYDKLKAKSEKRDSNGNMTQGAKKAQQLLNSFKHREEAQFMEVLNKQALPQKNKSKVIKGFKKFGQGVGDAKKKIYKWSQTDQGKAVKGYLMDSVAFAATFTGAAMGYGLGGDLASATMGADLLGKKGFAGAILQKVSNTTVGDAAKLMSQFGAINGMENEDVKAKTNEILNIASQESARGLYKELDKREQELVQKLTKLFDNNQQAAGEYINAVISKIINGDDLDLRSLMLDLNLNQSVTTADKESAVEATTIFASQYIKSILANCSTIAESSLGYDVDTFSRPVEKKVEVYNTYQTFYEAEMRRNGIPTPRPAGQGGPTPAPNPNNPTGADGK